MRDNIFAYTPAGLMYPPYLSVNQLDDEKVEIIVRSPKKEDGSCGDTAVIVVDRKTAQAAGHALLCSQLRTNKA